MIKIMGTKNLMYSIVGFLKFKSNQILGQFEFDQIKLTLIWIWFDSNIWIWIWFEFEFLIVIFKSNQIFVKSNQIWPYLNLIKSNIVKFEFEFDQIFDSNIWRSNQIAEPYQWFSWVMYKVLHKCHSLSQ